MDELRRKIILSAPALSTGLLLGCGGGEAGSPSLTGNDRSQAMANGSSTNQTLQVTGVGGTDYVWNSPTNYWAGGGAFLIPDSTVAIQACINGNNLSIGLVEAVSAANSVLLYVRSLKMELNKGTPPASNMVFSLNDAVSSVPRHSGIIDILHRSYDNSENTMSDLMHGYKADTSSTASGTITITSLTSSQIVLNFANVLFKPAGHASYDIKLSGSTKLGLATTIGNWL